MDAHTQMCLYIFLFFGTCIGIFIYLIDRSCKKDNAKHKQRELEIKAKLEEEKLKPMFKIIFQDKTTNEMHESALCEPYIWRYREDGIVKSKEVAQNKLKNGFEKGFLTNVLGVSVPMHNILNAEIVEQK